VSVEQFAASLGMGLLSVALPLLLFLGLVATLVYIARWWIGE
jgi:hypothetical protein